MSSLVRTSSSRLSDILIGSSDALVTVNALCLRTGYPSPSVLTIEESMPVGPILRASTLDEAVRYFLSKTDVVAELHRVDSFKVNGHELLHTFLDQPPPSYP